MPARGNQANPLHLVVVEFAVDSVDNVFHNLLTTACVHYSTMSGRFWKGRNLQRLCGSEVLAASFEIYF